MVVRIHRGRVNGPPPTSDCQPQTSPIGWLVLPFGVMLLTSAGHGRPVVVQPHHVACGQALYCSAGNSVAAMLVVGAVISRS